MLDAFREMHLDIWTYSAGFRKCFTHQALWLQQSVKTESDNGKDYGPIIDEDDG
jgi:hypothetical protein